VLLLLTTRSALPEQRANGSTIEGEEPMSRAPFRTLSWLAIGFALLSPALVVATQKAGPGSDGVLNCEDPDNKRICRECCPGYDCSSVPGDHVFCCQSDCPTTNDPPPTTGFTDGVRVRFTLSVGALKIQFDRDGGTTDDQRHFSTIKLKESFALTSGNQSVSLKTRLVGADATLGGLLFPVAYLALGNGALAALQNQGLDVSFLGASPTGTCQDVFPADVCTMSATGLSETIDSALATGSGLDRNAFFTGAQTLGYPPYECFY
jgi:hypothetical protein